MITKHFNLLWHQIEKICKHRKLRRSLIRCFVTLPWEGVHLAFALTPNVFGHLTSNVRHFTFNVFIVRRLYDVFCSCVIGLQNRTPLRSTLLHPFKKCLCLSFSGHYFLVRQTCDEIFDVVFDVFSTRRT